MEISAEATAASEVPLSQPLSQRGKSEEHAVTPTLDLSARSASVPLLNRGEVESQPESRNDPSQQQQLQQPQFSVHLQPLHTATAESGMFSPNLTGRFSVRIASDRPSSVEETPRESPSHASAAAASAASASAAEVAAMKHVEHHSIVIPASHLSFPITPNNKTEVTSTPSQARTPRQASSVIVSEESSLTNTQEFSAASVMSSEPISERASESTESLEATIVSSASSAASSSALAPSLSVDPTEAVSQSGSLAATAPPSYFSPRTLSEQAYTPTSTTTSSFSPAHAGLLSAASTPASLKIATAPACVICAKSNVDQPLIPGAQGLYFHAGCLAPQTPSSIASNPISPTASTSTAVQAIAVAEAENEASNNVATTIEVQLLRAELARVKLQQEEQQREQIEFERTHGTRSQFMRDAATAFAAAMSPRTQNATAAEYEEKQQLQYDHTHSPFRNIAHPYAATHSFQPALSTEPLITPGPSATAPLAPFPHPPCYPVPTNQMPFPVLSELDRAAPAPLPGLTAFNIEFPKNSLTANAQPLPSIVSPFHKPSSTAPKPQQFAPPAWGSTIYQPKCEGDEGRSLLYETAEEREEREKEETGNEYFPPEINEYAQADEWVANYDTSALNIYRGWGTVKKVAPPAPAPAPAPAPPAKPVLYAAAPVPARPPSPKEIVYEAPPQRPPPASAPSNGMFWADLHPTLHPDPAANVNYPRSHPLPPMSPLTQIYHRSGKEPSPHLQEDYAQTKKRMSHARY